MTMPGPNPIVLFVAWLWIALPILPLAVAWLRIRRVKLIGASADSEHKAIVLLTTASYLWIFIGLFFTEVLIGSDYSKRRHTTIEVNLLCTIVLTGWSLVRGRKLRRDLVLASSLTASVWFYMALVNAGI
jgi:hypothetical protein